MNPQETKLKQNIQRDIQLFQDKLTKLITDLVELEADIEYHFDKYNESVGNPETPDPHTCERCKCLSNEWKGNSCKKS